jgi:hypothetical protein
VHDAETFCALRVDGTWLLLKEIADYSPPHGPTRLARSKNILTLLWMTWISLRRLPWRQAPGKPSSRLPRKAGG